MGFKCWKSFRERDGRENPSSMGAIGARFKFAIISRKTENRFQIVKHESLQVISHISKLSSKS